MCIGQHSFFGLKSGRSPLSNLSGGRLMRELLKQYITEKQNGCLLSGHLREVHGHLREVVAMRELTVFCLKVFK